MADPNAIPLDRIRIFDRSGNPLIEFNTRVSRSWVIGDEGRASFSYASRKSDVVNERALQFGNWLLVENSVLPSWVGVLDTPREWGTREVTVRAYTPERVFSWRRGPLEEKLTGSAGTIFEKILQYVNAAEQTILQPGDIWRGGAQREETINPTLLHEDLKRLQERSQEEYQWRPAVFNGQLAVYADWLDLLGFDTGALLHEGREGGNIKTERRVMIEDGPIANDLLAYGDGETWQSKPAVSVVDNESIGLYGRRQESKYYSGVTNTQTLTENGSEYVSQSKQASRTFRITALNVGDTFRFIGLGNRLTLTFQNIGFSQGTLGFSTLVRILGMAYDPDERNQISLVVGEVL